MKSNSKLVLTPPKLQPKPKLDHARMHPVQCQAPGLFRGFRRGDRKKLKLDVRFEFGGKEYHFTGFEPLGGDDFRVMLSAVALCGPDRKRLPPTPTTEVGQTLQGELFPDERVEKIESVANKTTTYAIAREAGWNTKSMNKRRQIIASFKRIASVSVFESDGRYVAGPIKLMGFFIDEKDGRIWYTLHPMGALVLFGEEGTAKAMISLVEAREIKSDWALLLLRFLWSWVGPGHSAIIGIDAICSHIWGPASGDVLRQHRTRARKALAEIAKLPGWRVESIGPDKWRISRARDLPRLPG